MEENGQQISYFDIADWLWSFRWMMLAFAMLAVAWGSAVWFNFKALPPHYEIKAQVFSGGTPIRGTGEIADIIVAGLENPKLTLVSAPTASPVIFQTSELGLATEAEARIATIRDALVAEVRDQTVELEGLLPASEAARLQIFKARAFVAGIDSGLVPLIDTVVATRAVPPFNPLPAFFTAALSCAILFLLTAGTVTFVRAWKDRRQRVIQGR
jgi:hypothetical protein